MSEPITLSTESLRQESVKPPALNVARRFYVGVPYPATQCRTIYPVYDFRGELEAACYESGTASLICSLLNDVHGVGEYQSGVRKSKSVVELQQEVSDLEDEVSDLEDEVSDLEDEVSDLEDEVSDLEDEKTRLEMTIDTLERQLRDMRQEATQ